MHHDRKDKAAAVFPVALLTQDRPCLVVGAGKAGSRKAISLLEAGAKVTVVAPEATPEIRQLAASGRLAWAARPFEPGDVTGRFMVFAATNIAPVNEAVLAACRRGQVLCGIVDHGWRQGDLISPAILRREDGLTVAVSTGGRSCRRSRMIRDSILLHVKSVEDAIPSVFGADFGNLPPEHRDALALTGSRLEETAALLRQVRGVHEFALLVTCNRLECHAILSRDPGTEPLVRRILGLDALPGIRLLRGRDAFRHTAFLLAGLLSPITGETHIVAQVKAAYQAAAAAGWSGGMLEEWHASALHVAKAIRQAAPPAEDGLESRCLAWLQAEAGPALADGIIILGTGRVGRELKDLYRARFPGSPVYWIYHRRQPEGSGPVRVERLDQLDRILPLARVIVCATASPEPVLTPRHAVHLCQKGNTWAVDLGVPRNIDPALARHAGIQLTTLDDLHARSRPQADPLLRGEAILARRQELYDKLMRTLPPAP